MFTKLCLGVASPGNVEMAIFGKLVADKRLSILVENMRLEQIKQRKLVEDVRQLNNLWKERRPHVSKT